MGPKDVEKPATYKSTDDSQQDVEYDALTSVIYKFAGDEPGNKA